MWSNGWEWGWGGNDIRAVDLTEKKLPATPSPGGSKCFPGAKAGAIRKGTRDNSYPT